MTLFFGTCMQCDGISIEGWKHTSKCIVAYIHRKTFKTHNYDYQNLLQTRFWCWKATHVVNIGVVFWKVDSEAHLVITVPSSETFLVENYSRCRILQLDTARRDLTWGIQIHQQMWCWAHPSKTTSNLTTMNVIIIFGLGFGSKLQTIQWRVL